MRKLAALLSLLLVLSLSGCSGRGKAGFGQDDLVLTVSGREYRVRDNIAVVLEALGDGYQYAEGRSCDYDGLDKTYTYPEATFYTNPLAEGDLLEEIYSQSGEVSTSKGIKVGSAKDDVLAAYGDPTDQDDWLLLYRAGEGPGNPALCFEIEDGAVAAIFLTVKAM